MPETLEADLGQNRGVSSQDHEASQDAINFEQGHRNFSTRHLTVRGMMNVQIPGRDPYTNVTALTMVYAQPMDVDLRGKMAETSGGLLEVRDGRMQVVAYRENGAETALAEKKGSVVTYDKLVDPEVTISRGDERIVLNQLIGSPVVSVKSGSVSYDSK